MQTAATCDWNASGTSKLRGSVCPCLQHNTLAPGLSSGIMKRVPSWPRPKAIRAATKRTVGQIDWDGYAECRLVLQVTGPFLFIVLCHHTCGAYPSLPNRSRCEANT